jgi:hypothetical protein
MGRGAKGEGTGFEGLLGRRRGLAGGLRQERVGEASKAIMEALGGEGLTPATARDLSRLALDPLPEVEETMRDPIRSLLLSSGMKGFAQAWTESWDECSTPLQGIIAQAVAERLGEAGPAHERRQEASAVVPGVFLDDLFGTMPRTSQELLILAPVIEAVAEAYRSERLARRAGEGSALDEAGGPGQRSLEGLAACLGFCPEDGLAHFTPWRDELAEEISSGSCAPFMGSLLTTLRPSQMAAPPGTPGRVAFMASLNDAIRLA